MKFSFEKSLDTMHFFVGNSGSVIRLEILQGDSLIASSMDGYGTYQIVTEEYLVPGDTLSGHWLAPTTPYQDPKITLSDFAYNARVIFPVFNEKEVFPVEDISFYVFNP